MTVGSVPAAAVTRRPRVGARGLRSAGEQPERVDVGQRPAADADLDHVDRRRLDRQSRAAREAVGARGLELVGDERTAVLDQAQLGGRATHVEGHQVLEPVQPGEAGRAERTGGGAGLEHPDRSRGRVLRGGHAAVGKHHPQAIVRAQRAEPLLEVGEVAHHAILDVDARGRGLRALVLADLGRDVAGDRDAQLRRRPLHGGSRLLLVRRVHVAVQEADRDRLDPALRELSGERLDLVFVDRLLDLAVGQRAFLDVEAQVSRHQRRRPPHVEPVDVGPPLPRELHHVAEPGRGQQRDLRALALDQRVGDERRGVDHLRQRIGLALERVTQHGLDAVRGRGRRGERLADRHDAVGAGDAQVGERAPDVDSGPHGAGHYTNC